jgi:hypothetical protein
LIIFDTSVKNVLIDYVYINNGIEEFFYKESLVDVNNLVNYNNRYYNYLIFNNGEKYIINRNDDLNDHSVFYILFEGDSIKLFKNFLGLDLLKLDFDFYLNNENIVFQENKYFKEEFFDEKIRKLLNKEQSLKEVSNFKD